MSCSESRAAEDRKLAQLRQRLHRVAEVRRAHVLGEQPIERPLVHLEQLDLVHGANGGLATMGAEEPHLAERLAPGHRPEDAGVAGLRVLVLDLHGPRADDVERIGTVALTEHRLAGAEDLEVDAAREIGQHVLRQVVERRELVDQLRGLDPPGGLESEPDRPDQASDPPQQDPEQVEQASDRPDRRGRLPSRKRRIFEPMPALPQTEDQLTEDHLPEDEGRDRRRRS